MNKHDRPHHRPARSGFAGLVALICAGGAALAAVPENQPALKSDAAVCAAWDVHITTQIEDFGRLRYVDPISLSSAAMRQMDARTHCAAGRLKDAIEIFETIDFVICATEGCSFTDESE
ncbi:MAG: hypothetical protein ABWZ80_03825 [Beijerinckiaceae bacterium]